MFRANTRNANDFNETYAITTMKILKISYHATSSRLSSTGMVFVDNHISFKV